MLAFSVLGFTIYLLVCYFEWKSYYVHSQINEVVSSLAMRTFNPGKIMFYSLCGLNLKGYLFGTIVVPQFHTDVEVNSMDNP